MSTMLLAVWLLGVPAPASSLEEAERHQQALDFDLAVTAYRKALKEPGTREERLRAWMGLGTAQAFMGDAKGARASFERLLLLEPSATLPPGAGPKAQRPFDGAKKAMADRRNGVTLERSEPDGAVRAVLREDVPLAAEVRLHARAEGEREYRTATARPGQVAKVPVDPKRAAEAWAEALDEGRGVLYLAGSQAAPRSLVPVVRSFPALEAALKDEPAAATVEAEPGPRRWPIFAGVGAAVVVAAGATAAILASRPPPLQLPEADREQRLP